MREFVEAAAAELKMKISWRGKGANEKGCDAKGRVIVAVDLLAAAVVVNAK